MFDIMLQFVAAGILLIGLWLMGNHRKSGPALACLSESMWIGIFIINGLWGGVFLSTVLLGMQARNFILWNNEGIKW